MAAEGNERRGEEHPPADESPPTDFDEVMRKLKTVVERLERNDVPLEESLSAFEQGIALARLGRQKLDTAERRIEVLMRDGSVEPLAVPDE